MIYQYAEGLRLFLAGFTYMGKCRMVVSIPFALSLFPLFLGKFLGKLNDFHIINKPSAYSHCHLVPLLFIFAFLFQISLCFSFRFCCSVGLHIFFLPATRSFLIQSFFFVFMPSWTFILSMQISCSFHFSAIFFVIYVLLVCRVNECRKYPYNMIALGIFVSISYFDLNL